MINNKQFDISKLKGSLGKTRDWMKNHHVPPRLVFFAIGIISTIWFLIRVIPKPSRASYPCMRVAAPFMSGFVMYILTLGGITVALRKAKHNIYNAKYAAAGSFLIAALVGLFFAVYQGSQDSSALTLASTGPDDGPNQPMGTALGIKPGRVVWSWDTTATKRDIKNYYFLPENTNQKVVSRMIGESVKQLTGESSVAKSWDAMFRYFNSKKKNVNKGYTKGEKIFIKINQTSGRGRLTVAQREKGDYSVLPVSGQQTGAPARPTNLGTCETSPGVVLQILRQLVNECGIPQSAIAVGDPQNPTLGHNYDAWAAEFPDVVYTDRTFGTFGRTLIHPTKNDLLFYSDKYQTDKLYDIIENADYMINVANLKPHLRAGITLTAKNHFGSHSREGAYHLHYSHVSPVTNARPTNTGYRKYRVFVDLMGSKYLGRNTLLYVVDGLYAGGAGEGGPPVRYFMAPFNGSWSNSIFISQDQVALESVCYDFLRTEWNGTYRHDPSNNSSETMPNVNGVDDYLHQAADQANWPEGIIYDPDNSGKPLPSLGVHEHWNNSVNKQYSRNLGKSAGIELVSIPASLVGKSAPKMVPQTINAKTEQAAVPNPVSNAAAEKMTTPPAAQMQGASDPNRVKINSVVKRAFGEGSQPKKFYAGIVDDNNGKLFLTDVGIVSGRTYNTLNENSKIPSGNLKYFIYELSSDGPAVWIPTPAGAVEALLPIGPASSVKLYDKSSTSILSNNVLSIATGRSDLRWFGTDKGISALYKDKWLTPSYMRKYPESMFADFPITSMATSHDGDSLYVGTEGAGITRVFRNNVDGISGASEYAQWGPIEMPSDSVYSIYISRDGTQWIGTSQGVGKHEGYITMEKWTVYNTKNGLINNFVQAITADPYGNIWCGTKGGISVLNGNEWTSFTTKDGLVSNNILFILSDKNGMIFIGTDNGIMTYSNGVLTCYQ